MNTLIKKIGILLVSVSFLFGCSFEMPEELAETIEAITSEQTTTEENINEVTSGDILEVHFVDVGQADGILIKMPDGRCATIDSGDTSHKDEFMEYLENEGVKNIYFAVATHGHNDHIGGMKSVIESFDVDSIIRTDEHYDSTTYTNMLYAIEENGVNEIVVSAGDVFECGDVRFDVLAPVGNDYDDYNDFSVVIKMTYGNTSFLFTGDAAADSEEDMLASGCDLGCDVLKVGHHGSSGSNIKEFIDAVNPEISVISVGENNDYGHPHKEVLERLESVESEIYRTDKHGSVKVFSDGQKVWTETEKDFTQVPEQTDAEQNGETEIYIGNKNSLVYHGENCSSLPAEKNRVYITKEEAENGGYRPHTNCVGEKN